LGILLILTAAATFRFRDPSTLVVQACVIGWAGLAMLLWGGFGWTFSGFFGAILLFRGFQLFRDGATRSNALEHAAITSAPNEWEAGRVFPWAGLALSLVALFFPFAAAPGFGFSLSSVLSGYQHPTLSKVTTGVSGLLMLSWLVVISVAVRLP
jgi:hypothetical protein